MTRDPVKRKVQRQVRYAVKVGQLKRQSCEVCGAERVEAHHDDYSKPLDVRWLCRRHHSEVHRDLIVATRPRKLTEAQVAEIRRRHRVVRPSRRTGCSSSELAREFGITRQYVQQLVRGLWRVGQ